MPGLGSSSGSGSRLKGKSVIVTGGSKGLGRAIILACAAEGASVTIAARNMPQARQVAEEARKVGADSLVCRVDVRARAEVQRMVEEAVDRFGKVDVLVNNAGVSHSTRTELLSEEEWDSVVDTNLKGVLICSQAVGSQMMKQNGGKIINIASVAGEVGIPRAAAYCASKAGVIALTKVLAVEWARHNILVNSVAPAYVEGTELLSSEMLQKYREAIARRTPLGRLARAEEVAELVIFLASDNSTYTTGQTVFIDGGWLAYGAW